MSAASTTELWDNLHKACSRCRAMPAFLSDSQGVSEDSDAVTDKAATTKARNEGFAEAVPWPDGWQTIIINTHPLASWGIIRFDQTHLSNHKLVAFQNLADLAKHMPATLLLDLFATFS